MFEYGTFDFSDFNEVISLLSELVRHNSGFQFRKGRLNIKSPSRISYCVPDQAVFSRTTKKTRDKYQMERFFCGRKHTLQPSIDDRTLLLTMCHEYHSLYAEIRLIEEIQDFIESHGPCHSPTETF